MKVDEKERVRAAEQNFKEELLALGLLSEITVSLQAPARRPDRQPVPVAGNAVSERVMRERR